VDSREARSRELLLWRTECVSTGGIRAARWKHMRARLLSAGDLAAHSVNSGLHARLGRCGGAGVGIENSWPRIDWILWIQGRQADSSVVLSPCPLARLANGSVYKHICGSVATFTLCSNHV